MFGAFAYDVRRFFLKTLLQRREGTLGIPKTRFVSPRQTMSSLSIITVTSLKRKRRSDQPVGQRKNPVKMPPYLRESGFDLCNEMVTEKCHFLPNGNLPKTCPQYHNFCQKMLISAYG